MADHSSSSQSPHGTEKRLRVTRPRPLVRSPSSWVMNRAVPMGPGRIHRGGRSPFQSRSASDIGVRLEGNQALCNIGDSNPAAMRIVGVLVFCPVPKGKCLRTVRTAYRNSPGRPMHSAGQPFQRLTPIRDRRDYRGRRAFRCVEVQARSFSSIGRNQKVYGYRMGRAYCPVCNLLIA